MIDDKALELGRLLGQSEEYRALVRATDRMKEDAECQKLLADVERVAQEIDRAAQANFEKLMARMNARIYEGIKKGAASPIITLT